MIVAVDRMPSGSFFLILPVLPDIYPDIYPDSAFPENFGIKRNYDIDISFVYLEYSVAVFGYNGRDSMSCMLREFFSKWMIVLV